MRLKKNAIAALALTALMTTGAGFAMQTNGAAAQGELTDPSMRMINGYNGVKDTAVLNEDGELELGIKASPGFGTRTIMSNLPGYGLVDVKEFTTTISLQYVPVGITTVFSLQTVETGTIGGGNGNGVHVMLRMDDEDTLTFAAYNQAADVLYAQKEKGITLDETKDVQISFSYTNQTITVTSPLSQASMAKNVVSAIDSHYADNNYLGYWNLSCYFMGFPVTPASQDCQYVVRDINGVTPRAMHTAAVEEAVTALETGYATLTTDSTAEEIAAVSALNVFNEGSTYASLLKVANGADALVARIQTVQSGLAIYEQRVEYDAVNASFEAFKAQLETYDPTSEDSKQNASDAYNAIDFDKMNALPEIYKTQLETKFTAIKAMPEFKAFILDGADVFFTAYEEKIVGGDVTSLANYKAIVSIETAWAEFKQKNGLDTLLDATALDSLEARAAAVKEVVNGSFYSRFWTEGDTWKAELTEQGIWATGLGDYGETLGFNKKLTVGENASITFNIIYALKTLGANHLHIGFYPAPNTGTFGTEDGVRVDFWFAGNVIEIKPVNGATETEIFTGAYLAIDDTGYFDMETADYTQGQYTVELDKDGDTLIVRVNGYEMELDGLAADLFANGCYMTISAMSVSGADQNEIVITNVGGVSYIDYDPSHEIVTPPAPPATSDDEVEKSGCGSVIGATGIVGGLTVMAAAVYVTKKKED